MTLTPLIGLRVPRAPDSKERGGGKGGDGVIRVSALQRACGQNKDVT